MLKRITIIGGGNWGTTMGLKIAKNVMNLKGFDKQVTLSLHDEDFDGRRLSDIINQDHHNPKYLPGYALPLTLKASPLLEESCSNADVIIFATPHNFLARTLARLSGKTKPSAVGVSLIKGIDLGEEGPELVSDLIQQKLSLSAVGVLMGANIASDVAKHQFVESTLACNNITAMRSIVPIFECSSFHVQLSNDPATAEMCGALKNVVAMGAGFCDALKLGDSSKAAVLRQGTCEMAEYCALFSPSFQLRTMLLSSGVADVVASSYGGRNRRCSEVFASRALAMKNAEKCHTHTTLSLDWQEIEAELLNGQKLQGLTSCDQAIASLESLKNVFPPGHKSVMNDHLVCEEQKRGPYTTRTLFPLLYRIYAISRENASPTTLFDNWALGNGV